MIESIFSWVSDSIGTWTKKVLSALGIGWISFEGITTLADNAKTSVLSAWGGIPADVLQLVTIGGFGTAFGVILSALMYRASIKALGHFGRVLTGGASS